LLTVDDSSGLGLAHGPMRPHRTVRQPEAASLWPATSGTAPAPPGAPSFAQGAAFHAQQLGQFPAQGTLPPHRAAILAAYHAHLAGRIRFYGPLTPLDLRV
jgi:hypothetical protein